MSWLDLTIMILATHRAIALWFGPTFFQYVRGWLMKRHPVIDQLVNCPICMSVWIGGLVAISWLYGGSWSHLFWLGVALSGAAELLQGMANRISA